MATEKVLSGWCYLRNGETCGPVSQAELQGLLMAGQVYPRQLVWPVDAGSQALITVTAAILGDKQATTSTSAPRPALPVGSAR